MTDTPNPGSPADQPRDRNADEVLGGADAVEKTTYVTGSGTDPEAMAPPAGAAKGTASEGVSATVVIIAMLFIAAVLVYLLGYGR